MGSKGDEGGEDMAVEKEKRKPAQAWRGAVSDPSCLQRCLQSNHNPYGSSSFASSASNPTAPALPQGITLALGIEHRTNSPLVSLQSSLCCHLQHAPAPLSPWITAGASRHCE